MTRNAFLSLVTATALVVGASAPHPASAGEGLATIPLGNAEICVGLISCLFSDKPDNGRGAGGVSDHRPGQSRQRDAGGVSDHRRSGAQGGTGGRDTAGSATGPVVRDHRTVVRDHRTQPQNEVVPASDRRFDCRTGAVMLQRMGYSAIRAYDCDGPTFHYTARDDAALFRAEFSAYSGDMKVTFVGIAG